MLDGAFDWCVRVNNQKVPILSAARWHRWYTGDLAGTWKEKCEVLWNLHCDGMPVRIQFQEALGGFSISFQDALGLCMVVKDRQAIDRLNGLLGTDLWECRILDLRCMVDENSRFYFFPVLSGILKRVAT